MFLTLGDRTVYYERRGSGRPIVFIHGLGAASNSWFAQAHPLSEKFETVVYDWWGSGCSSKAAPYSIEDWAAQAAGVCRTLGIENADFVGHSMGSAVVIALAASEPKLVRSIALLGPVTKLGEAGLKAIGDRAAKVRAEGMGSIVDVLPMGALAAQTRTGNPAVHALFRSMIMANDAESYAGHCEALLRTNVIPLVPEVTAPALLISGDSDPTAPSTAVADLSASFRFGEHVIVANGGHAMHLDQPSVVNQHLETFFSKAS